MSEPNLLERGGSDQHLETAATDILKSRTVIDQKDFNYLIKQAKKNVKDYSVFENLATSLGVHHLGVGQAIREMDRKRSRFSFDGDSKEKEKIMQTILLQWMLMKGRRGTAEELIKAMQNSTQTHSYDVFNKSILRLLNIIDRSSGNLTRAESTMNMNTNSNSNPFGTLFRGRKPSKNLF